VDLDRPVSEGSVPEGSAPEPGALEQIPPDGERSAAGCRECREWPAILRQARQAAALEGPARTLVHALKYEGWEAAGGAMAAAMLPSLPSEGRWQEALLVPVPTTEKRARRRGYNQAAVLATELARRSGRRRVDALIRKRGGGTQVALHPEERRANVRGAFELVPGSSTELHGRPVVLVDDVLTTGATGAEVAEVLKGAAVTAVCLVTFARTLPDRLLDTGDPPGETGLLGLLRRRERHPRRTPGPGAALPTGTPAARRPHTG
jgi:ComF family protein